jgi:hypothetical protein
MLGQRDNVNESRNYTGGHATYRYADRGARMAGGWAMLVYGMAAGAALMYLFDPERGRSRRALLRDKMVGMSNDIGETAGKMARDLSNRAEGVIAEAGSAMGMTGEGGETAGGQGGMRSRAATASGTNR